MIQWSDGRCPRRNTPRQQVAACLLVFRLTPFHPMTNPPHQPGSCPFTGRPLLAASPGLPCNIPELKTALHSWSPASSGLCRCRPIWETPFLLDLASSYPALHYQWGDGLCRGQTASRQASVEARAPLRVNTTPGGCAFPLTSELGRRETTVSAPRGVLHQDSLHPHTKLTFGLLGRCALRRPQKGPEGGFSWPWCSTRSRNTHPLRLRPGN